LKDELDTQQEGEGGTSIDTRYGSMAHLALLYHTSVGGCLNPLSDLVHRVATASQKGLSLAFASLPHSADLWWEMMDGVSVVDDPETWHLGCNYHRGLHRPQPKLENQRAGYQRCTQRRPPSRDRRSSMLRSRPWPLQASGPLHARTVQMQHRESLVLRQRQASRRCSFRKIPGAALARGVVSKRPRCSTCTINAPHPAHPG